ncbi:hypothetical protein ACEPAF_6496 [Sanghuangporus sanghuang]
MVVHPPRSKLSLLFAMSNFDSFKATFKGDIVTPDHPDYDEAIQRWAKNAIRRAKIVAFVHDAHDASLAIKYARDSGLPLAIRGGGHNPSGSSSSEGIVIDLSRYINECRVDPEEKLAYVGGGALWKTVDETAIKYGLAAVGGTVNHTGVGGLTLGGGFGWLAGAHGLAIDNLVQATMVIADGSIVTASESENSDLFWAIRGGGCNFGICTEFVFRLHEQRPTVYSGILIYPPPLVDQVLNVTAGWLQGKPRPDACLLQAITRGPPPEYTPCIVVIPFYNGTEEEGRKIFSRFLDIGPIDLTKAVPYEQQNGLQNDNVPHGLNYYMRGALQREYSPAVAKAIFDRMCEVTSEDLGVSLIFELFPLEKINSVSNNATAFNLRGPDNNVLCISTWDEDSPEGAIRGKEAAHAVTDIVATGEGRPDASKSLRAYGNYVGDEKLSSDRAQKVFGDNYPRLQQIKKRYDPDMIFSNWFQIIPA